MTTKHVHGHGAIVKGATGDWEMVIGVEIHAQVASRAKLFSGASTDFGAGPNSQVSLLDAAMPGTLPVINRRSVEAAVMTGLALGAEINRHSVFDRKNYFYPDLPHGYQISQYGQPIVGKGKVTIDLNDGGTKEVGITRLHLEMDAGKSLHDQHPDVTYVDLNRAGVTLMEIVSEPDMRSPAEVAAFVRKLRTILRYLGTCDGNMEKGNLRTDVNLSVRRPGGPMGTRTETKNVNSIRFIGQAIEHEARRQVDLLEDGGRVRQETRLYDPTRGETRPMRSKEEAEDYRYFPDPDLLPLELDEAWIEELKASLPELPDEKKARFERDYALGAYEAGILVSERDVADYYERVAKGRDAKLAANWVITDLFGHLNKAGLEIAASPVSAGALGALLDLMGTGVISGRLAKDVFEIMFETGEDPRKIVEERGLKQVTDAAAIGQAIDAVLARETEKVAEYRAGKDKLFSFFIGQVMRATAGKANPKAVNELLREKLEG